MKSIRWMLLLALVVATSAGASVHAASHAKRAHTMHPMRAMSATTCPVADPSLCPGTCPRTATSAAKSQAKACPVADPSKCPASCRNTGTGATAVNAAH